MLDPSVTGLIRSDVPRTGAPAIASTALIPAVRKNVLFPDMFDPLTSSTRVSAFNRTEFRTHFAAGISGCPNSSPSNTGCAPALTLDAPPRHPPPQKPEMDPSDARTNTPRAKSAPPLRQ